jgi:hypothetical protein
MPALPRAHPQPAPPPAPAAAAARPASFDWPLAFDAETFLRQRLESFLQRNRAARLLARRMQDETGTDFFDWMDHLVLAPEDEKPLRDLGFASDPAAATRGELVLKHPRALLPRVRVPKAAGRHAAVIALRPESVADFAAAHSLAGPIEGDPFGRLRRVVVSEQQGMRLEAVERNGCAGFVPAPLPAAQLKKIIRAQDLWRTRPRHGPSVRAGFAAANAALDEILRSVGPDLACQLFFAEERRYWEARNRAAQIQKRRQDRLGLGWGNHDHHTLRCSREYFVEVIQFLLRLGFVKRERFYAGAEAGWGAQISEQPAAGIVVFADVDLMPGETQIDFSTTKLPPAPRLGTVGLWTALHGESFLEAGLHHLEARFDFELLRGQLQAEGVATMKPFSDFKFLRQAFTEGERWPVPAERAEKLLQAGLITREQREKFVREGALGSHLENLQRRGGFKGFNQKSVSVIISATDPRAANFGA